MITKNQPLVTIVTPSFNQASYIEFSLRSVLQQDYGAIEYLVVDGGSTDGSVEIIRKYADRLAWWVSEADSGQAEAINKGFLRAHGEVVAWLNSDDLYLPGAVTGAVRALQANPDLGMTYGNAITIDARGQALNQLVFPDWDLANLMGYRIICQPAVFMRRSTLDQVGLLDSSYHFLLDHHLWLRIAARAPIAHVAEVWAAARHHPAAKNVAQAGGFGQEAFRILTWMQSQPALAALLEENHRQVLSGAHRLNARYLLDGGRSFEALKAYWQAILAKPGFALQHWHRMIYALLDLLGGGYLANWYYWYNRNRRPNLGDFSGLKGWPGLCLDGDK